MRNYLLAAVALRVASSNKFTRLSYRAIGNHLRSRRSRGYLDVQDYIKKGTELVAICNKYDVIHPHDKILELGTGWSHAHSLLMRLQFDVEISMFDIADIRSLDGTISHLEALSQSMPTSTDSDGTVPTRTLDGTVLNRALKSSSFAELYQTLSLEYMVERDGSLAGIPDNTYQCVFSGDVLEHISADKAQQVVNDIYRILVPGGYSIHLIGLDDHLAYYDRKASPKNYLRYSERVWKAFFENRLQYVNRIQASEWVRYFANSGFACVESETTWSQEIRIFRR